MNIDERIKTASGNLTRVREEIGKRVVGQRIMIDGMLMGLITGGHVLLEGVPGLAKTMAVRTLSEVFDVDFKRLQFTPDLLPADLIGSMVYLQNTGEFIPRKGPVFSNIILADEINRAPAKVQSALLEAMQEKQVTIGDSTYPLSSPFFVLATQNPIEHEGTYPLPEAQLDRFIVKILVDYPSQEEELDILRRLGKEHSIPVKKVLNSEKLEEIRLTAEDIKVDERLESYIVALVAASRKKDGESHSFSHYIEYGASSRATLYFYRCAKVKALFSGRSFVIPEDIKDVAYDVFRHRIILSYEAEAEELKPEDIISRILSAVPVP